MVNVLFFSKIHQFRDVNGDPAAGGTLKVYKKGETTLSTIYSDAAGTPLTNPVTLPANGRVSVYVERGTEHEYIVTDKLGNVIGYSTSSFPGEYNQTGPSPSAGSLTPDKLAAGTANRLLGKDSSGAPGEISAGSNLALSGGNLTYTGTSPSNDEVELLKESYSSVTSITLSGFTSTYEIYRLEIGDFTIPTNGTTCSLELGTDSATFLTNYALGTTLRGAGASSGMKGMNVSSESVIPITYDTTGTSGGSAVSMADDGQDLTLFNLVIWDPSNSGTKTGVTWDGFYLDSVNDAGTWVEGMAEGGTTGNHSHVRITFNNAVSCQVRVIASTKT